MPTYNYKCTRCKHELEAIQKITEEPLIQCPECKKNALERVITTVGFILKGDGFYNPSKGD